jgi:hypothetical protein
LFGDGLLTIAEQENTKNFQVFDEPRKFFFQKSQTDCKRMKIENMCLFSRKRFSGTMNSSKYHKPVFNGWYLPKPGRVATARLSTPFHFLLFRRINP